MQNFFCLFRHVEGLTVFLQKNKFGKQSTYRSMVYFEGKGTHIVGLDTATLDSRLEHPRALGGAGFKKSICTISVQFEI